MLLARRTIRKIRTVGLAAGLALACLAPSAQAEEIIRLTNGEWKPYQSEELPHYGPYSQIASLVFAEVGIKVEYGFFPWNRAMKLAKDGHWDGTFFWVATPERRQDYLLSNPVITLQEVLFFSLDRPLKVESLSDFEGLNMGRIQSSAFGGMFEALIEQGLLNVTVVPTNEHLFQMLSSGRVDFVPELINSGYDAVDALEGRIDISKIAHNNKFSYNWVSHMLISRNTEKGPYFLEKFNEGLAVLMANGTIERIMAPILRRNKRPSN